MYFSHYAILKTLLSFPLVALHSPVTVQAATIEVSSQESLLDQEVVIRLVGLRPRENVEIRAEALDARGITWKSYGLFQADRQGVIDLSKQAPLQGSYEGIDSMGLFWAMHPPQSERGASFKMSGESFSVKIIAYSDGTEITSREIVRLRKAVDVKQITVREDGLVALLFLPPSEKALPVIITLSGSNGGLGENRAQLLASSSGCAVLALGYFGVEGLPEKLQDIPLEYFETAFAWIKKHPSLDASHVGIYGISRGAELALILGSWFPDSVQAIAAVVPSAVIHGGLSDTPVHAWTYRGAPLAPFAPVPKADFKEKEGSDPEHAVSFVENFLDGMHSPVYKAAAIPVEKIKGSILLISGGDDKLWPSELYATQIQKRLEEKNAKAICEHLHYPKAGHAMGIPLVPQSGPSYYHPVGKFWLTLGGTPAEDNRASRDAWDKLVAFFQRSLRHNSEAL
jgi:dienelactone hydrolase